MHIQFPQQLQDFIKTGESETLEFKKSTAQLNKAGEALCAFLNTSGGIVLLGVTDSGRLVGQQVTDATRQEIAQMLQRIEPRAPIIINYIAVPNTTLQIISLQAQPLDTDKPYTYAGRAYQRVQNTTVIMPQAQYQCLLLERMHGNIRWENMPALQQNIDALDHEAIMWALKIGIETRRIPATAINSNIEQVLQHFGLLKDGILSNAAIVLFGKKFLPDYIQCVLRLACFKGNDKNEFVDNKQIHDHAFQLLEEALIFVNRHLPIKSRILPNRLQREDDPLIPPEAIREAIVNAICHRDYTLAAGSIDLAIYDNRLEIISNGGLPFGLDMQSLMSINQSRPRNPEIASVFYRCGYIEQWGRGLQKITDLCARAGVKVEFFEVFNNFCVRFVLDSKTSTINASTVRQQIIQALSEGQELNLSMLKEKMHSKIPDRTLRSYLLRFKQEGIIDSQGFGRGAVWVLK